MPAFVSICRQTAVNYSLAWVAVDEAWFGKQRHSKRGKQTIVMGGIEVDTRRLRPQVIPDTEQDSIELFLEVWVARGSHLITDAHASYNGV